MTLYQAVAGAKITAAEWNTIYNLLKGVVGGEDTVRLANNVAGTFMLQPNTDPASVVHLFPIKTQAGVEKFALRSDGVPVLADQAGTPGSLENGMLWRNGDKFYGRLGGATVELITPAAGEEMLPARLFEPDGAGPSYVSDRAYPCWLLDPATDELVRAGWKVPACWGSGTITAKIRHINYPGAAAGNVRWGLHYMAWATGAARPGAWSTLEATGAVAGTQDYWADLSMGTLPVTNPQMVSLQVYRDANHTADTFTDDIGFLMLILTFTPS